MDRKRMLPIFILMTMLVAAVGCQPIELLPVDGKPIEPVLGQGDEPDLHVMMIVGEETVFLSHLPLFDHPHHDFQAILEVEFTKSGSDPHAVYVDDRQTHRETKIYTLVPEPFVLPSIASTNPEPLRSFQATIVRGHFEKGGQPIVEDVQVEIKNVIHFRQFDPAAVNLPQLEYLLFGKGSELFLAHLITKPPDFDQIVSVQVSDHALADEALREGIPVSFPDRTNTLQERLLEGERIAGTGAITVEAEVEFYFEEGELLSPPTFNQTEAERVAGF